MLLEADQQFDVVDSSFDWLNYKLLVLPDHYPLTEPIKAKLEEYLSAGGKLIASFEAGMDIEKTDFQLDSIGVQKASDGPTDEDGNLVRGLNFLTNDFMEYIIPSGEIGAGLKPTEYAMYSRGMDVIAKPGSQVLIYNTKSYFDRRNTHFCSHKQTPSSGKQGSPAIIQNSDVIYFSHPIFTQYFQKAPPWCKQIFINALQILTGDPIIETNAPSTAIVTLNEQPAVNRLVLHILHYIPERRGQEFDIIADIIPLHDVAVTVRVPEIVKQVQLAPEQEPLTYTAAEGIVQFVVPRVHGHQMVEIAYQGDR
jgi:hypothetical protein